jgi:predicted PurR-regulated permease PerM
VPSDSNHKDRGLASLHIWQIQALRDGFFIAALLGLLWLGYAMRTITIPLLIALGLAYLFEPLIDLLGSKWRVRRKWAVLGILSLFSITVVLVIVPTLMLVVSQTAELVSNVRSGKYAGMSQKIVALLPEEYQTELHDAGGWFGLGEETEETETENDAAATAPEAKEADESQEAGVLDEAAIREIVQDEYAAASSAAQQPAGDTGTASLGWKALGFVKTGASQVFSIIGNTVAFGLLIFLVPFYFFFFSSAYPRVQRFGRQLIPENKRTRVLFLIGEMDRAVSGFVRGRLVISLILGVVLAVGWFIAGVPYSIALGLIVGIFCAVPYLSVVGLPIAIGLLAVEQYSLDPSVRMAWWAIILWPTVVYAVAQFLDDWVLTPAIQGKSTKLDPVSIVVAVLAGGALAGIYGMLLAVPAAACIRIMLKEVFLPRINEWIAET